MDDKSRPSFFIIGIFYYFFPGGTINKTICCFCTLIWGIVCRSLSYACILKIKISGHFIVI
jgi:hypothetical protein